MTSKLPSLFIGSSVEGLHTAYAIQQALDYDAEPTVWNQGLFQPSQSVFSELFKNLPKFEFAVFVFSLDDTLKLRGAEFRAVRDNVIFEMGLFMGALGPSRCFYLVPRTAEALHLPSDLAGIVALSYNPIRSDNNLLAALGPACNEIRTAIKLQTKAVKMSRVLDPEHRLRESATEKLQRYIRAWDGELLSQAREIVRQGVPLSIYELDEDNSIAWAAFAKVFYFLESLCAAVMAGEIDSDAAKQVFGKVLLAVWKHASTALTTPNHVEESWNPLPHMALLNARWNT